MQNDLESDLKQMERKMGRLVKERDKRSTKRLQQSEKMFQRVGKREAKIAQKMIRVIITADDGVEYSTGLSDDDE